MLRFFAQHYLLAQQAAAGAPRRLRMRHCDPVAPATEADNAFVRDRKERDLTARLRFHKDAGRRTANEPSVVDPCTPLIRNVMCHGVRWTVLGDTRTTQIALPDHHYAFCV